jgi:hypothetical protein
MDKTELIAVLTAAFGAITNLILILLMWSHQNKRFDDIYRYIDVRFKSIEEKLNKIENKLELRMIK